MLETLLTGGQSGNAQGGIAQPRIAQLSAALPSAALLSTAPPETARHSSTGTPHDRLRRTARGGRARARSAPHGLALTKRRIIDQGRRTTMACRG